MGGQAADTGASLRYAQEARRGGVQASNRPGFYDDAYQTNQMGFQRPYTDYVPQQGRVSPALGPPVSNPALAQPSSQGQVAPATLPSPTPQPAPLAQGAPMPPDPFSPANLTPLAVGGLLPFSMQPFQGPTPQEALTANQQLAGQTIGGFQPLTGGLLGMQDPFVQAAMASRGPSGFAQNLGMLATGALAPFTAGPLGMQDPFVQAALASRGPSSFAQDLGMLATGAAAPFTAGPLGMQDPFAQAAFTTRAAPQSAQDLAAQTTAGFSPFMQGPLGQSPMTQAAIGAFTQNTLPVIQNQMALQGLGSSPALGQAVGQSLATALPQFIQGDLSNRLAAIQGLQAQQQIGQGQQQIGQQGIGLAGQLAGQAAQQRLAGAQSLQQQQQLEQAQQGLGQQGLGLAGQFAGQAAQQRLAGAQGLQTQLGLEQAQQGLGQQGLGLAGQLAGQAAQQRLAGLQGLQQQQQLTQGGFGLASQIANQQAQQRLAGVQGLQAQQQLGQQGAGLAAQIANQEAMRGLQAAGQAGSLYGGLASGVYNPMAQLQQAQWQQGLQGFGSAGQLQRDVTQGRIDAATMDFLRQQGLAEQATTGIFGGSVLPPAFQQSTSTSGGK